jgi:cell shape-determining protein MreD
MVYAGLCTGLPTVCLAALCGGLWLDSLSANPLGISVLPLFAVGVTIHSRRDLILRGEVFAQFVLGLAASAVVPLLTLLLLLTLGHKPLIGYASLWQWVVMSAGGAVFTPLFFVFFEWLDSQLRHGRITESSFRPDREIRRGR